MGGSNSSQQPIMVNVIVSFVSLDVSFSVNSFFECRGTKCGFWTVQKCFVPVFWCHVE